MTEQKLMKDGLGPAAVKSMAEALGAINPAADTALFRRQAVRGLKNLELKQRVNHLITVLNKHLPEEFSQAAKQLSNLPKRWPQGDPADPLRSFAAWPFIDYVAEYGLQQPEISLPLLRQLTGLFSAEFAIRPFIVNHYRISLRHLQAWTGDPDDAVRRLVSEGTRPRLPWGRRLPAFCKDPSPVLALLEHLNDDRSETVRRSVANNLNDISKDNPDQVIRTCRRWLISPNERRTWIVRHATRSLVKSGHPDVFALLGYTPNPALQVAELQLDREKMKLGQSLAIAVELVSTSSQKQKLVIDYAIHHVKADGSTRPKVFKLGTRELAPGEAVSITKAHAIRPITTRTYYPGTHAFELLINGRPYGRREFELTL